MVGKPHGGRLVNRVVKGKRREKREEEASCMQKIEISEETVNDCENIANGVLSPLEGFMNEEDFLRVLHDMRLADDYVFTMPIILDVSKKIANTLEKNDEVALVNKDLNFLAVMEVEEIYRYEKKKYAEKIFKTRDISHPGVRKLEKSKDFLLGGKIEVVKPSLNSFDRYTLYPIETRILFKEKKFKTIVGFQTRNAPHLGHEYTQKSALTLFDGIFINPIIGKKKAGDFRDEAIVKAYEVLMRNYLPKNRAIFSILRCGMKYAGPREAVFHALMRKNFGCTHFIVGRDHAGVGNFYPPYAAQKIFSEFPDLGITPIFMMEFFYCKKCRAVTNEKVCPHPDSMREKFSGTEIRKLLMQKSRPPEFWMRPEVTDALLDLENPFVVIT